MANSVSFRNRFVVCVHDVMPQNQNNLQTIFNTLQRLIPFQYSVAVVAQPWVDEPAASRDWLSQSVSQAGEVLFHGLTHQRQKSLDPFSVLVNHSDEFRRLNANQTAKNIQTGVNLLAQLTSQPITGFAPPAWCTGLVDSSVLRQHNLNYLTRYFEIVTADDDRIRTNTWSWDCGRYRWMGYVGEYSGRVFSLRNSIPQIVLHPADVDRGFLPFAVCRIEKLLAAGAQPVLYREVHDAVLHSQIA